MTETTTSKPLNIQELYKIALGKTQYHEVDGKMYSALPFDKTKDVVEKLMEINANDSLGNILNSIFDYGINNSELSCGKSVDGIIHLESVKKETIKSKDELIDIILQLIGENSDINISESLNNVFDKDANPTFNKIVQDTWRAMVVARNCHCCEMTNKPEIGVLVHIASAILSSYLNKENSLSEKWDMDYYETATEGSNSGITGAVDTIIAVVRDNKEKYSALDRFFSSTLKFGNQKMNYYNFVEYIK